MADDLTRVSGIGKATAERLAADGVASFAALAGLGEADAERLGVRPEWIAQAKELSSKIPAGSPDPNERVAGPEGEPPASEGAGPTPGAVASASGPNPTDAQESETAGGGGDQEARSAEGATGKLKDEATPAQPAPEGHVEVLVVIGPKRGRRRAGLAFGPQPEVLPLGAMTAEEISAIEGDPVLTTRRDWAPLKES